MSVLNEEIDRPIPDTKINYDAESNSAHEERSLSLNYGCQQNGNLTGQTRWTKCQSSLMLPLLPSGVVPVKSQFSFRTAIIAAVAATKQPVPSAPSASAPASAPVAASGSAKAEKKLGCPPGLTGKNRAESFRADRAEMKKLIWDWEREQYDHAAL